MRTSSVIFVGIVVVFSSLGAMSCTRADPIVGDAMLSLPVGNTVVTPVVDSVRAEKLMHAVTERYREIESVKATGVNRYQLQARRQHVDSKFDFEIDYRLKSELQISWQRDGKKFYFDSDLNGSVFRVDGEIADKNDDGLKGLFDLPSDGGRSKFQLGAVLLLKERGKGLLSIFENLRDVNIIHEELIDGTKCQVIEAKLRTDDLATFRYWIDPDSLLILQYQREFRSKTDKYRLSVVTESYQYKSVTP